MSVGSIGLLDKIHVFFINPACDTRKISFLGRGQGVETRLSDLARNGTGDIKPNEGKFLFFGILEDSAVIGPWEVPVVIVGLHKVIFGECAADPTVKGALTVAPKHLKTDGDVVENQENTRHDVDLLVAAAGLVPAIS